MSNNAGLYFLYICKHFTNMTDLNKPNPRQQLVSSSVLWLFYFLYFWIWFSLITLLIIVSSNISSILMTLQLTFKMTCNKISVNCEFLRRSSCLSNWSSLKSWMYCHGIFLCVYLFNKSCVPKIIKYCRIMHTVPCTDCEMHCRNNINLVSILVAKQRLLFAKTHFSIFAWTYRLCLGPLDLKMKLYLVEYTTDGLPADQMKLNAVRFLTLRGTLILAAEKLLYSYIFYIWTRFRIYP